MPLPSIPSRASPRKTPKRKMDTKGGEGAKMKTLKEEKKEVGNVGNPSRQSPSKTLKKKVDVKEGKKAEKKARKEVKKEAEKVKDVELANKDKKDVGHGKKADKLGKRNKEQVKANKKDKDQEPAGSPMESDFDRHARVAGHIAAVGIVERIREEGEDDDLSEFDLVEAYGDMFEDDGAMNGCIINDHRAPLGDQFFEIYRATVPDNKSNKVALPLSPMLPLPPTAHL